ncbi:MAG: hypothetical protein AB1297_04340, partial [bacterium]
MKDKAKYQSCLSEIATERDWLWGMPRKLNLMGISVDVGRDTVMVNPIDNDQTKIKKYMTLTLYNGSVNEHLTLDIPMGTITGVSGVKAIQISNQQGIPIYKIDKTNISSILPILQQDVDVKGAIQDAVNAGYEVIVPEREIIYYGWQGTGYIIQDPTTGAGACLISGGAAGAMVLAAVRIIALALADFVETNALIVEGDTSFWVFKVAPFYIPEMGEFIIAGATFIWGYLPICKKISTAEGFLNEAKDTKYKILYFIGHGWGGGLCLYKGEESVTAGQISGIDTSHFTYVHLDACHSIGVANAFASQAKLGY